MIGGWVGPSADQGVVTEIKVCPAEVRTPPLSLQLVQLQILELIPWNEVFFKKLVVARAVKKISAFHGT
jgi:hypothetical protein